MSYDYRPYSTPDPISNPPQQTINTTYLFRPPRFRGVLALGLLALFSFWVGLAGIGQCVNDIRHGSHFSNGQLVGSLTMAIVGPSAALMLLVLAKRLASNAWAYKKAEAQFYYGRR